MGGTGCVTLPGTGLVLSSGTLSVQSPSVNPQALAQIDPSTVAGNVVGTQSLDSVADDLERNVGRDQCLAHRRRAGVVAACPLSLWEGLG